MQKELTHLRFRYYIEVRLDGKIVLRRRLGKSFTKQFGQVMAAPVWGLATAATVRDVNNTTYTCPTNPTLLMTGNAGDDSRGVQIGTDNTAVAYTDYKLGAKISNGTGAGQMSYQAQSLSGPTVGAVSTVEVVSRSFLNVSGAQITVKEAGIVILENGSAHNILIARDVLAASIDVPNNTTLAVSYTLTVGM